MMLKTRNRKVYIIIYIYTSCFLSWSPDYPTYTRRVPDGRTATNWTAPSWETCHASQRDCLGCATVQEQEAPSSKDAIRLEAIASRLEAITTRNKKLLGAKDIATSSKEATSVNIPGVKNHSRLPSSSVDF